MAIINAKNLCANMLRKIRKLAQLSAALIADSKFSPFVWLHHLMVWLFPAGWVTFLKNLGLRRTIKASHSVKLKKPPL